MIEALDIWSIKLDQLQRDRGIQWWIINYGQSLLKKTEDFVLSEQNDAAEIALKRLESWFDSLESKSQKSNNIYNNQISFDDVLHNKNIASLDHLKSYLKKYQNLVPRMERLIYEDNLERLDETLESRKNALDQKDLDLLRADIMELHRRIVQRIRRSMRAQLSLADSNPLNTQLQQNEENVKHFAVGPYNNLQNIGEILNTVRSRDPIWVEDLLQCYHHLLQFSDKLTSTTSRKK